MRQLPTPLPGVFLLAPEPREDSRGLFARVFCTDELAGLLAGRHVVQINHSRTRLRGALRGMHFQHPPAAEMKFVRCVRGAAYDVVVDLRAGSPTFLGWFGATLSPENMQTMVVPEGCAHGFQTLEPDTELVYLHTAPYTPALDGGVRHDDPRLGIAWPLPVAETSPRDAAFPLLDANYPGITP